MENEESFKIVVTRGIDFPSAPSGSHPYDCQADCRYCDAMDNWQEGYNREIESVVEDLEGEFEADVEHLADTGSAKQKVLYWLEKLVKDTEESVKLANERGSSSFQHYGQSITGVPLDHSDSVIKAFKMALSSAKHEFKRAGL